MSYGLLLYLLATSALLSTAAWMLEIGLGQIRGPRRWPWVGALVLSLLLAVALPFRSADSGPTPTGVESTETPDLASPEAASPYTMSDGPAFVRGLSTRRPGLGIGMLAASGVTGTLLLIALFGLARRAASWTPAEVNGWAVRLTSGFGPALVGLFPPEIALPRSTLALDDGDLEMILRHEDEHRRAGDHWVLRAGTFMAVLLAWNPIAWIQLYRLRRAVEIDCDARVLASGVSPARYGRLLLSLETADRSLPLPVPMFGARVPLLERRLMMMKMWTFDGRNPARAWALGIAALGVTIAACDTPTPAVVEPTAPDAPLASTIQETDAPPPPPLTVEGVLLEGKIPPPPPQVSANGEIPPPPPHDGVVVEGVRWESPVSAENVLVERVDESVRVVAGEEIEVPNSFRVHRIDGTAGPVVKGEPAGGVVFETPGGTLDPAGRVEVHLRDAPASPPLLVVDGVITSGPLSDLPSDDIESIEVVKGGAAVELYGERAKNGVVIVTTKR